VRHVEALTLGSAAFVCQIGSLWALALPAPWAVAFLGMVSGDARSVLVVVLAMQTLAIAVFIVSALTERSALRAASLEAT